mgnify:CR=1 FL=1
MIFFFFYKSYLLIIHWADTEGQHPWRSSSPEAVWTADGQNNKVRGVSYKRKKTFNKIHIEIGKSNNSKHVHVCIC